MTVVHNGDWDFVQSVQSAADMEIALAVSEIKAAINNAIEQCPGLSKDSPLVRSFMRWQEQDNNRGVGKNS